MSSTSGGGKDSRALWVILAGGTHPRGGTIRTASEQAITMAHRVLSKRLGSEECLTGYEGNAFAFTGSVTEDLLGITSVHAMREDALVEFLKKAGAGWEVVEKLIRDGALVELTYQGVRFYTRRLLRQ